MGVILDRVFVFVPEAVVIFEAVFILGFVLAVFDGLKARRLLSVFRMVRSLRSFGGLRVLDDLGGSVALSVLGGFRSG